MATFGEISLILHVFIIAAVLVAFLAGDEMEVVLEDVGCVDMDVDLPVEEQMIMEVL